MALPSIGELNRRVAIRQFSDVPNNVFGSTLTEDTGITRWAKIAPVSGALYFGTKQVGDDITHRVWVRYGTATRPQDITGAHVIECEGSRYRVKRASDFEGARQFTMIEVTLLGSIA